MDIMKKAAMSHTGFAEGTERANVSEKARYFGEATLGVSSQLTKAARRKTALDVPCSLRKIDRSLIWSSWTTGLAAKKHKEARESLRFMRLFVAKESSPWTL